MQLDSFYIRRRVLVAVHGGVVDEPGLVHLPLVGENAEASSEPAH
jgi:hypothetical protein